MARHKDAEWNLPAPTPETWEQAGIAVLMDIRDRLDVLRCWEFTELPAQIRRIAKNTSRPRKSKPDAYARHRKAMRRVRAYRAAA